MELAVIDEPILMAICMNEDQCAIMKLDRNSTFCSLQNFFNKRWPGVLSAGMILKYCLVDNRKVQLLCEDDYRNMLTMALTYKVKQVDIDIHRPVGESSGSMISLSSGFLDTDLDDDAGNVYIDEDDFNIHAPVLLSDSWQHTITGLHQEFRGGATQFRSDLIKFSIYKGFQFVYLRNNKTRIIAVCKDRVSGCNWKIYATSDCSGTFFYTREYHGEHTCGAGVFIRNSTRMNSKIIADEMVARLQRVPTLRPIDVVKDMSLQYACDVSYKLGFNGVEGANALKHGSYRVSYDQLRIYAEFALQANPGSRIFIESDTKNRFTRFFLCFHASIVGFEHYCRPMLFVDSTFLTGSRYRGQLLCATAKDGNNNLFPFAFAVVDIENEANWTWFMEQLKAILSTARVVTFVSDRHKGLLESVSTVFPESPHGFCIVHLKANLRTKMGGKAPPIKDELIKKFDGLVYARTVERFNEKLIDFKTSGGKEVTKFIDSISPEHYSDAYFVGKRFGEVTSNAVESLNNKLLELRQLPVLGLIDGIRQMIMQDMDNKRTLSASWGGTFCPSILEKIVTSVNFGKAWGVSKASDDIYEVHAKKTVSVNLLLRTCTCRLWQIRSFPCSHAFSAIQKSGHDIMEFIDPFYFIYTYRCLYSLPIFPVPTMDMPVSTEANMEIQPPIIKSQPERRRRRRLQKGGQPKKQYHCSQCKEVGHNRGSCTGVAITEEVEP